MSLNLQRLKQLLRLTPAPRPFESEIGAYERLRSRGLTPDGIIDVGAYEGEWTKAALSVWPQCPVLMIEPQVAKKSRLEGISRELPNVEYRQQLLGARPGQIETFYEMETGSSIYPENSNAPRKLHYLETSTLDLIAEDFLGEQIFLKIDVQGAEIDVLTGAQITIKRSTAVQLELPFVKYNRGAPSFSDVIMFMDRLDFSPAEISNMTVLNGIFIQCDIIFLQKNSIIFSEKIIF